MFTATHGSITPLSPEKQRLDHDGHILKTSVKVNDRLCALVVRVPDYRSRGPGSILGATRFSEK
jgi:hypothetical protein